MAKKPSYRLKALNKVTDKKSYIGAGWKNDDGSISIVLDLCVVIPHDPNLVLTLFPVEGTPPQ